MKKKNFYDALSQKLKNPIQDPTKFDREFWLKFDREFKTRKNFLEEFRRLFAGQGVLYPASAIAGIFLMVSLYSRLPKDDSKAIDLAAVVEWNESTEIAQDLDLFEEDWVVSATDEDWEVLLNENET